MMYRVGVWGLRRWKENDKIQGRFFFYESIKDAQMCSKSADEFEFKRESTKGKVLYVTVKYWLHLLHMDAQYIVINSYEQQINNLKTEWWGEATKGLEEIGLVCIWQTQSENNINWACKIV
jgi:hypothetical protein